MYGENGERKEWGEGGDRGGAGRWQGIAMLRSKPPVAGKIFVENNWKYFNIISTTAIFINTTAIIGTKVGMDNNNEIFFYLYKYDIVILPIITNQITTFG